MREIQVLAPIEPLAALVGAVYLLTVFYVHIHHLILSLLALQRFFLYFFSNQELFNVKEKRMTMILMGVYIAPIFFFVIGYVLYLIFRAEDIIRTATDNLDTAAYFYLNLTMLSLIDILSTPLIIQLTYLFCNRRNVQAMRRRMAFRNIYCWFFKRTQVEPDNQRINASTTV
ncbi:hypothetical protein CAEBREN_29677 [Caenorhabditis brenneri]|uniref:Uncharacterized protein n=1 Tax=Caenorhabditis brenneri TaxID=135651 RepID=G0PKD9_CAEBE|nr:hypothetical protein CAEBREN_29677 [Caenorhabditis brenneri]